MVNKFIIFCECNKGTDESVRYVSDTFCSSNELQECLVHFHSIGVKVFKIIPILVDEQNGLINLEHVV